MPALHDLTNELLVVTVECREVIEVIRRELWGAMPPEGQPAPATPGSAPLLQRLEMTLKNATEIWCALQAVEELLVPQAPAGAPAYTGLCSVKR